MTADISVIICAYSEARWNDLVAAVSSVQRQHAPPREIIVVIDHNTRLLERAHSEISGTIIVGNQETRGLSGARNTGLAVAQGAIVAFLDDDAIAASDWLERLSIGYADPQVLGVGGVVEPLWLRARPVWFPDEFNWVVGCTYRGLPEDTATVRNLIGANMSFRREVFSHVRGFRSGIGRIGTVPLGCEETELCIRINQRWPQHKLLYEPRAKVYHRVPASRGQWHYFFSRCYAEGRSKALVARFVGAKDGLASERTYTFRTLPRGVTRGFTEAASWRNFLGLALAGAIVTGLAITTTGYLAGLIAQRLAVLRQRVNERSFTWRTSTMTRSVEEFHSIEERSILQEPTGNDSLLARREAELCRVLLVTPRYFPHMGGVENHVYQVAQRLAQYGIKVAVLTTDLSNRLPAHEKLNGVEIQRVRAWPAKRDYYLAPDIYRIITNSPWDIIHIQSYHTLVAPLAMLAALRARIPYVVTFHGGGHSSWLRNAFRRRQRRLLRPLLARAQRLVAVARFEISLYADELRLPKERFTLIPNGSDLPLAAQPTPVTNRGDLIVSIGRLERYKGHHRVIAALPQILKQRPDVRLRIAGSGPYEAELHRLAAKLNIADRVEIRAIPAADRMMMAVELTQASLVTLLSEYETQPIAALEALASGRSLLVADAPGLRELTDKGLARAVSLDSTAEQIAAAVVEQLERPLQPPEVVLPTWDDCARALLILYQSLLGTTQCVS